MKKSMLAALAAMACCHLASTAQEATIETPQGRMTLTAIADNAIRVQVTDQPTHATEELIYDGEPQALPLQVSREGSDVQARAKDISVRYDVATGDLTFGDASGRVIARDLGALRSLSPSLVQGEPTYDAMVTFGGTPDERIYGLGQFQDGYLNVKGLSRRLTQVNTQIALPVYISTDGYGLLWHNYGMTEYNEPVEWVELQRQGAEGAAVAVEVTTGAGAAIEQRRDNTFAADIDICLPGRYSVMLDVGQSMARKHHLAIDGKVVIDVNNVWLPPTTSLIVDLEAGRHTVTVEGVGGDAPRIGLRAVDGTTALHSPVAQGIDYTVIAGTPDQIIATYRQLTGHTPLMPLWALGYIHCRERYDTQAELLDNAAEFRRRGIPIDVIVQDWQYWGSLGWNAMAFDPAKYPDPASMVDSLHAQDMRLMLSVWAKHDKNSELGALADSLGYLLPGTDWVDFFNPKAADFYWKNQSERLLPFGIDAWWQDATEPENDDLVGRRIAAGTLPGEVYRNAFPLFVNRAVYGGLRKDDAGRRAMILTRSAFPGMQRYATATWSGDVGNDFETLRRQIIGGLGQMAAGQPWWTYDAGGFFRPSDQYDNPQFHERFIRWLQTATFLPLMRTHGFVSQTEPWRYGAEVDSLSRKYINLRYSLLPYTYSTAAQVSHGSTMMRPLVFDFADDPRALDTETNFMFGPSILVAPVLEPAVTEAEVYLPKGTTWYDFWTNTPYPGGQTATVTADLSTLPLFVRAGSIIPMAHGRQHSADLPDAPIELHIYPGADGHFTLYEDDGVTYGYEQGEFATIDIAWDDALRTLTLGDRAGSYPGMPATRQFIVTIPGTAPRPVTYTGTAITLPLK